MTQKGSVGFASLIRDTTEKGWQRQLYDCYSNLPDHLNMYACMSGVVPCVCTLLLHRSNGIRKGLEHIVFPSIPKASFTEKILNNVHSQLIFAGMLFEKSKLESSENSIKVKQRAGIKVKSAQKWKTAKQIAQSDG